MGTRAKLYCDSVHYCYEDLDENQRPVRQMHEVILKPVSQYTGPNRDLGDEDSVFGNATPCGEVKLTMHEEAARMFEPGKKYYATFEPTD